MRKRYKIKKRSCALCKPNKMGWSKRWNNKEFGLLKEFEKEQGRLQKAVLIFYRKIKFAGHPDWTPGGKLVRTR